MGFVAADAWLSGAVMAHRIGFSQFQQDSFVVDLLAGKRGGIFIDVGASDGVSNSNSYLLEAYYGWRGVCVEPGVRQRLLAWLRPRCINIMAPASSKEKLVVFHRSARTAEHSGIVETSAFAHSNDAREGNDIVRTQSITLNATLTAWQHSLWPRGQPQVVDYLSLDTEGHEMEALRGFPFNRVRLRVATIERNAAKNQVDKYLRDAGMKLVGEIGADDLWVTSLEHSLVQRARMMLAAEPPSARARASKRSNTNATKHDAMHEASPSNTRWRERVGLYIWLEGAAKAALPFLNSWR